MHPDEIQILLYLEDKLPAGDRAALEAHIAACAGCASRFAAAARLPEIIGGPDPVTTDERTRKEALDLVRQRRSGGSGPLSFFAPRYRLGFGLAAALLVAIGVTLLVPDREPSRFRSEETGSTSLELFPEDGARMTDRELTFRWTSLDDGMVYRFTLMGETGAVVWSADIRDTSLSIPTSVVLQSGKTYLWKVESFLADKRTNRSYVHAFTYKPG
jgi:hypothetical protein